MRVLAAATALALLAFTHPAVAQRGPSETEQAATADELASAGLEAQQDGRHADAIELFERSLAIETSMEVQFRLAVSLQELGRLVLAHEFLTRVARSADARAQEAQRIRLEIAPRLGRLRVSIGGEIAGTEVTLDGDTMPEALIGVDQVVDPGEHTLRLVRNGDTLQERVVRISSGELKRVLLRGIRPRDVAEVANADEQLSLAEVADDSINRRRRRRRRVILISVVLTLVATATSAWVYAAREDGAPNLSGDVPITLTLSPP